MDGLENDDVYIDMGEGPDEDLVKELWTRVKEARANGISEDGAKELRRILFKHK